MLVCDEESFWLGSWTHIPTVDVKLRCGRLRSRDPWMDHCGIPIRSAKKSEQSRTAHLPNMQTELVVLQGAGHGLAWARTIGEVMATMVKGILEFCRAVNRIMRSRAAAAPVVPRQALARDYPGFMVGSSGEK